MLFTPIFDMENNPLFLQNQDKKFLFQVWCLFKISTMNTYGYQWSCQYLVCMELMYNITNILSNNAVDSRIR